MRCTRHDDNVYTCVMFFAFPHRMDCRLSFPPCHRHACQCESLAVAVQTAHSVAKKFTDYSWPIVCVGLLLQTAVYSSSVSLYGLAHHALATSVEPRRHSTIIMYRHFSRKWREARLKAQFHRTFNFKALSG